MLENLVKLYDDISRSGRIQDLSQLAVEHGFSFIRRQTFGQQATQIKGFRLFEGKGIKRLIGIIGIPAKEFRGQIRAYDYLSTRDLDTSTHSVVEIYCAELSSDPFLIKPKSALNKMKRIFVSSDRIFPQLKEFHSMFEIIPEDPEGDLLLKQSALDLMSDLPGITIEASGNYFLFYYRKKEIKVNHIMALVDFAVEFIRTTREDLSGEIV